MRKSFVIWEAQMLANIEASKQIIISNTRISRIHEELILAEQEELSNARARELTMEALEKSSI